MMLEMKRVVLLLSVVLLTCAAPLYQNNELSSSHESQVTSQVTQFRGTPGSDIIIGAPTSCGKPNEKVQSTVTVSLWDENSNVSVDIVSIFFVRSKETLKAKLGESNGGFGDELMQDNGAGPGKAEEKINTDDEEEASEEESGPTTGPGELKKNKEETPNPVEDKSEEDQIRSTSSQSNTRVDSGHPKTTTISATSSLEGDSNESDFGSEHQKTTVHTDQSDSAESSVLYYLPEQLIGLGSGLSSTLVRNETTFADTNDNGFKPRSDISSAEGHTVTTNSETMLGPFQTASALSTSKTNETDDPTPRKTPSLNSGPESMANTEVVKNEDLLTPFSSGSDFDPEYVNDDWQYDPRYYDPYSNHPEYAAGYDPYGAGYDPYGAGYDPYGAGYDPYGEAYDPHRAEYDPHHAEYDPHGAEYDPYRAGYDPYQAGYDIQEPYHETESEDLRHDVEQEATPAYSIAENERNPTEMSNSLDNSYSEEQPQSHYISPSSTPVSLAEGSENMDPAHNIPSELPSNSSSTETSREIVPQPSKGPNDSGSPDSAVTNSEEGTGSRVDAVGKNMTATGSSSSEESVEITDSEQESQNLMDQAGDQETPDPVTQTSSHMSVVQVSHNTHRVQNEEGPQTQSPVELLPALSSEEDDPLVNTLEHIVATAFNGGSNEEGPVVETNPDSTPSGSTVPENNRIEESNESTTESPGISAEMTRESIQLTAESQTFDSESVPTSESPVSNDDTSSENNTPNPSNGGLDSSAEANANADTVNDSKESQESQIFTSSVALPTASQPSHMQHPEDSSDEEDTQDRKSKQGIISQFPVETPAKIIAANIWTSFLQALNVPITNQSGRSVQRNVRKPQSPRRFHQRSSRRQKADSSEESK